MTYALVSNTKIVPAADAGGTSGNIDTTGADLIVFTIFSASGSSPTATDSKGNTYALQLTRTDTAFAQVQIYSCSSPTVGSGHNFTTGGGSLNQSGVITAWSGSKLVGVFDQSASDWNGGVATIQPGSITPTENDCLLIATTCFAGGTAGVGSIDSGFFVDSSLQLSYVSGSYYGGMQAYLIETSAAAQNPTTTLSVTPTRLSSAIASFKSASPSSSDFLYPRVILF